MLAAYKTRLLWSEFNTHRRHSKQRVRHTLLRTGRCRCGRFHLVLISTDKAVRRPTPWAPVNACGRTLPASPAAEPEQKHASAWCVSAMYWARPAPLSRYFEKQWPKAARLPLTHQDITRCFMTTFPKRHNWLSAGAMGQVMATYCPLDMGESVKLSGPSARQMIVLSGLKVKMRQHPRR